MSAGIRTPNLPNRSLIEVIGHYDTGNGLRSMGRMSIGDLVNQLLGLAGMAPSAVAELSARLTKEIQDRVEDTASARSNAQSAVALVNALKASVSSLATTAALADLAAEVSRVDVGIRNAERPGDSRSAFTFVSGLFALSGEAEALTPVGASMKAFGTGGSTVRLTGNGILAARQAEAIEPGRITCIRAALRRRANASDPANDTVRFGVVWLDQAKNVMPGPAITVVVDFPALTTASGRQAVEAYVAGAAADGVTVVAPAGAVYFRRFVYNFGLDGVTDVEVLSSADVTGLTLPPAISTDYQNRLAAQESLNTGPRLDSLEVAVGNPNLKTFATRSDAAAAAIAANVVAVRTLNYATPGDKGGATYVRAAGAPNDVLSFRSQDGAYWTMSEAQVSATMAGASQSQANATAQVSAVIQALSGKAGGRSPLPAINLFLADAIMRSGVHFVGQGKPISADFGTGTILRAIQGASTIIKAADDAPLHSARLERMGFDGRNLAPGGACVRLGLLESVCRDLAFYGGGSPDAGFPNTVGFQHLATFPASWIDIIENFIVTGFGVGLLIGGSDSLIRGHYISANGIGLLVQGTTGSHRQTNNMIDLCDTGLVVESPPSTYFGNYSPPFSNRTVVCEVFDKNKQHVKLKFIPENGWASSQFAHIYSACLFNFGHDPNQTAFSVDDKLWGGSIFGCTFAQNPRAYDLEFGGPGNTGWMGIYNSDKPVAGSILNMPPDMLLIRGGPGGQKVYFNDLTVNDKTNLPGIVSDAKLNVYGNDGVLGAFNVCARFGIARDTAGADVALLIGITNGNTPRITAANGERTTSAGLLLAANDGTGCGLDAAGNWVPNAAGSKNCGTPARPFNQFWATNNAIQNSDQKLKTEAQALPDALLAAAADIEIVWFKYLAAIAEKGEDKARQQVGVIAQQVLAALAKHGIDEEAAFRWGFIGRDPEMHEIRTKRTVEHPVYRTETRSGSRIVVKDGKAYQEAFDQEVSVKVTEILPLFEPDGSPRMEMATRFDETGAVVYATEADGSPRYERDAQGQVIMEDGRPIPVPDMELRQATYARDVTTTETIEDVTLEPTGGTVLAVRYEQLALLMIAAQRQKVSALEARVAAMEAA